MFIPTELLLLSSLTALDGPPVIVVESKVSQYRQAEEGLRRELSGATELEPSDPQLADRIATAPVVVAIGRKALDTVRPLAQQPLVFCMVLGVTGAETSKSVTGVPMAPDPKQVFDRIRALAPAVKRVGYIHGNHGDDLLGAGVERAAQELGFTLVERGVADGRQAKAAFDGLNGTIDALYLPPDPKIFSQELLRYLLTAAAERKLPIVGFLDSIAQAGALAAVSPNYTEIGLRAGKLASEILKRPEGKRIPVPSPVFAPGQVSINLKTARILGLDISSAAQSAAAQVYQ